MEFSSKQLNDLTGYLESIENLSVIAQMLIKNGHDDLLATVLEELYEDAQTIMIHCIRH